MPEISTTNVGFDRMLMGAAIHVLIFAAAMIFALVGTTPCRAQTAAASAPAVDWETAAGGKQEFDVASVKQTVQPSYMDRSNVPLGAQDSFTPSGGLFSTTGGRVVDYMVFAYKLTKAQRYEIADQLPKWANSNSYAIEARAAGNPTKDQYRLMMQALLANRFKLAFHYETKQMPVLALVMNKPGKLGPNLRLHPDREACSNDAGTQGPIATVDGGYPVLCGAFYQVAPKNPSHYVGGARNVPMSTVAESLTQFIDGAMPVVDRTGLTGSYDFLIDFALAGGGDSLDAIGPTFLDAVRDQLGLRFDNQVAPVDILVIDHVEEPSQN
jgi:uncharacterized protein (TIGR03435 family)